MKKYHWYAISAIVVLLFLYFVYPTRYIYLDVPVRDENNSYPVRVDRITGKTQYLKCYSEYGCQWETTRN